MSAFVVPHDPDWKEAFFTEASEIEVAFGPSPIKRHHIGSTAIPGILAKPIIDLLGEVHDLALADANARALEERGYEIIGAYGIEGRRYLRRTDGSGRRTHHLHIFEVGSPHIERHLAFRDYLTTHADIAADYSSLKAKLTSGDEPSWNGYVGGKDPYVRAVEPRAIEWYRKLRKK